MIGGKSGLAIACLVVGIGGWVVIGLGSGGKGGAEPAAARVVVGDDGALPLEGPLAEPSRRVSESVPGVVSAEPVETPSSLLDGVGNRDAIAQIAEITGLSEEAVYERVLRVSPDWLEWDLEPLEPWDAVEPTVVDHLTAVLVGLTAEEQSSLFEINLLGQSMADFLVDRNVDTDWSAEDRLALENALSEARDQFDLRWAEARLAIEHKVGIGAYDRWPYVTMGQLRTHTNHRRPLTMATSGGIPGSWIVQIDFYEGEYPQFDLAHQEWRDVVNAFRAQLAEWGGSY